MTCVRSEMSCLAHTNGNYYGKTFLLTVLKLLRECNWKLGVTARLSTWNHSTDGHALTVERHSGWMWCVACQWYNWKRGCLTDSFESKLIRWYFGWAFCRHSPQIRGQCHRLALKGSTAQSELSPWFWICFVISMLHNAFRYTFSN